MICDSPTVRLVSHCFTTRKNSTSRTGRAKKNITQYQSYQFVYIGQPSSVIWTSSARLLRECPDLISESLSLIFNQAIDNGIFLDEWKSVRMTPLFKKTGNTIDPPNYRPISIILVVANVFQRIVYDQLYHYLNENDLLSQHQSGFHSLHSTVTPLIEATDNWSLNIRKVFIRRHDTVLWGKKIRVLKHFTPDLLQLV